MVPGPFAPKPSSPQVSYDEGSQLAREYGVAFLEASAKTNVNVTEAFQAIAQQVVGRIPRVSRESSAYELKPRVGGKVRSCAC